MGDALAISAMKKKKFNKSDFKQIHPSGSLGAKLKTVEDIMLSGEKIPFVDQNINMKKALKILSDKKLGVLIVQNKTKITIGIITDGQIRRVNQKKTNLELLKVRDVMTKNPIFISKNELAAKALMMMNNKKITSLCVHNGKKKEKPLG